MNTSLVKCFSKNQIKIFFTVFLFFISSAYCSWTFKDRQGNKITIDPIGQSDLKEEEEIFITAFLEAYKDFSPEQLGVKDKLQFLQDAFADVKEDFAIGKNLAFSAKKEGKVIGFVCFKPTEVKGQVYIAQLAVSPFYWQNGVGKELVFFVLKAIPETNHLVVIPRQLNEIARKFYEHLKFKVCDYMHPGYDPNKYIGYEWKKYG